MEKNTLDGKPVYPMAPYTHICTQIQIVLFHGHRDRVEPGVVTELSADLPLTLTLISPLNPKTAKIVDAIYMLYDLLFNLQPVITHPELTNHSEE